MYNSEQFLRYSKQYLNTSVTDESISQVREVAKDIRRTESERYSSISQFASIAEQAVFRWLQKSYHHLLISEVDHFFPDYVLCDPESGKNLGFEVKTIQHLNNFLTRLREQQYRGYYEIKEGSLEEITFVFVAVNEDVAIQATKLARKRASELPSGVNLLIGIVHGDENELEPIFSPVSEFSGV